MSPDHVSYVPLLRKIGCSEIIRHAELFQLWGYLLIHAAYHPKVEKVKSGRSVFDVTLQLGEVFVQITDLSQFLNQPVATLKPH